mmetsp:Transcript_14707/g.29901  ORF Transcript_14707/g.29901 Transcript_14707/m.29901 type:complete len:92 (-) Transcript_14707:3785-4060(-)
MGSEPIVSLLGEPLAYRGQKTTAFSKAKLGWIALMVNRKNYYSSQLYFVFECLPEFNFDSGSNSEYFFANNSKFKFKFNLILLRRTMLIAH